MYVIQSLLQDIIARAELKSAQKKYFTAVLDVLPYINTQHPGMFRKVVENAIPKDTEAQRQLEYVAKSHSELYTDYYAVQRQRDVARTQLEECKAAAAELQQELQESQRQLAAKRAEASYLQNLRMGERAEWRERQAELDGAVCERENAIRGLQDALEERERHAAQLAERLGAQTARAREDYEALERRWQERARHQAAATVAATSGAYDYAQRYGARIAQLLSENAALRRRADRAESRAHQLAELASARGAQLLDAQPAPAAACSAQSVAPGDTGSSATSVGGRAEGREPDQTVARQRAEIMELRKMLEDKRREARDHVRLRDRLEREARDAAAAARRCELELERLTEQSRESYTYKNGYSAALQDREALLGERRAAARENESLRGEINRCKDTIRDRELEIQRLNEELRRTVSKSGHAYEIAALRKQVLAQQQQIRQLHSENKLLNYTQAIESMLRRRDAVNQAVAQRPYSARGRFR